MHVSKEFLMEAFGLSLLVALILISTQIFHRATRITTLLESKQEQQIAELEEYEIIKYDGLFVDGMTAIGYIKTITGTYQLPITVTTVNGDFVIKGKEGYAGLRDIDSEYYMNPLEMYLCEVIRDENGAIEEISISVEKKGN